MTVFVSEEMPEGVTVCRPADLATRFFRTGRRPARVGFFVQNLRTIGIGAEAVVVFSVRREMPLVARGVDIVPRGGDDKTAFGATDGVRLVRRFSVRGVHFKVEGFFAG